MIFQVMSRRKAIEYAYHDNLETCIIISISNSDDFCPKFASYSKNNIKDILYLNFDDIQPWRGMKYWKKDEGLILDQRINSDGFVYEERIYQLMKQEDADKIVEFVNKWYDKVDKIIVHCNAGISRSSGVCAAIMKYKTDSDSQIFDNSYYHPNTHCYNLVLNAFVEREYQE